MTATAAPAQTLHISDLITKTWDNKRGQEVAFWNAIVRASAAAALESNFSLVVVEVGGNPRRMMLMGRDASVATDWSYLPPLKGTDVPPDVVTKAQESLGKQRKRFERIRDGKESLISWGRTSPDLSRLHEPENQLIKQHAFVMRSVADETRRAGSQPRPLIGDFLWDLVWDFVRNYICRVLTTPYTSEQLEDYAETLCRGDATHGNELSAAFAKAHEAGHTDRLIQGLREKYPAEAECIIQLDATAPPDITGEKPAPALPDLQPQGEPKPPEQVELSAPMTKAEMARRVFGKTDVRSRKIEPLLKQWGVEHVSGRMYRVRLDLMDANTRAKIESPH